MCVEIIKDEFDKFKEQKGRTKQVDHGKKKKKSGAFSFMMYYRMTHLKPV